MTCRTQNNPLRGPQVMAAPQRTTNKFKSGLEKQFYLRFKLPYETNRLSYTVQHNYTPDFTLAPNLFVETKGLFTGADRNKHLYIRKQHPEVQVLFVFQNPNLKLSKGSRTTYANWCDQHGFKYLHINEIAGHSVETLLNILTAKGTTS